MSETQKKNLNKLDDLKIKSIQPQSVLLITDRDRAEMSVEDQRSHTVKI